eukprot:EC824278.1.p1 GENE.EC824278.1~~EC824278.1.p1  ORF type:complete len:120 (+),score=65.37 EC824278.1:28-360(+)
MKFFQNLKLKALSKAEIVKEGVEDGVQEDMFSIVKALSRELMVYTGAACGLGLIGGVAYFIKEKKIPLVVLPGIAMGSIFLVLQLDIAYGTLFSRIHKTAKKLRKENNVL